MLNERTTKKVLGLIPARKGSKRLPGKNTRLLGGKPLIAWTIEAAQKSKLLTQIVCSTDDEAVMRICADRDVEVIVRPAELATDTARSEDVVLHALGLYPCDYVCLLQPTSPFRSVGDIDGCIRAARQFGGSEREPCGCVSSTEPHVMRPNGAVYVARPGQIRAHGFTMTETVYRTMPASRSIDIDTAEDFERAEAMLREGFAA